MAKPKKPVGRPTKYLPEFCAMLVEWMKLGHSFESFATEADVAPAQLYKWERKHPEFREAHKKGHVWALRHFETEGLAGLWNTSEKIGNSVVTKSMNSAIWCFSMKNRFGWRDSAQLQVEVIDDLSFDENPTDDDDEE